MPIFKLFAKKKKKRRIEEGGDVTPYIVQIT